MQGRTDFFSQNVRLMELNETKRTNDINENKLQLERSNRKILIANCAIAVINEHVKFLVEIL